MSQGPTEKPNGVRKGGELPGLSLEAAAARATVPGQFIPRAAVPTAHPRKVKNGLKLASRSGPVSAAWAAQRWLRLVEDFAGAGAMNEGLIYARTGQARTLSITPGTIGSAVQGRMPFAYDVRITLPVLGPDQWAKVIDAMLGEARHLAGLLAGEVPPNIEDLFSPLRLRLFPQEQPDLAVTCSCGLCGPGSSAGPGWCKHVACVMSLVAERLGLDTFLIFALRGMPRENLLDELRQRRAVGQGTRTGSAAGTPGTASAARPVPAYLPRLPGLADIPQPPLEDAVDSFWTATTSAHEIDLTMTPPAVTHPLLRRLGASPFDASTGAKFPLVGLLATCYDVITEHTLRNAEAATNLAPPHGHDGDIDNASEKETDANATDADATDADA